jgi:hypothetical protein
VHVEEEARARNWVKGRSCHFKACLTEPTPISPRLVAVECTLWTPLGSVMSLCQYVRQALFSFGGRLRMDDGSRTRQPTAAYHSTPRTNLHVVVISSRFRRRASRLCRLQCNAMKMPGETFGSKVRVVFDRSRSNATEPDFCHRLL